MRANGFDESHDVAKQNGIKAGVCVMHAVPSSLTILL